MTLVFLLAGYAIANGYTLSQIWYWASLGRSPLPARRIKMGTGILYGLLALIPVLGAFLPNSLVQNWLTAAGNVWLGVYLYLTGLLLLAHGGRALYRLKKGQGQGPNQRMATCVLAGIVAASLAINGYGYYHARQIQQTAYQVTLEGDFAESGSLRIVLLADLHLGVNSDLDHIQNMVDQVKAAQPDLILVAGDHFTSTYAGLRNPEAYQSVLEQMTCSYGVYAVYGNHDTDETLFGGFAITGVEEAYRDPDMTAFLQRCGWTLLDDQVATVADGQIGLIGRRDANKPGDGTDQRASAQDLLAEAEKDRPCIVLEHEPVELETLGALGADLILSGHTHQGQLFPGNLITPLFNENNYGVKNLGTGISVVTSGVGYYGPPIRVGTNSEIVVLDVTWQ